MDQDKIKISSTGRVYDKISGKIFHGCKYYGNFNLSDNEFDEFADLYQIIENVSTKMRFDGLIVDDCLVEPLLKRLNELRKKK